MLFEVLMTGAPNEKKKIGKRLRMQFSAFSYRFMAFLRTSLKAPAGEAIIIRAFPSWRCYFSTISGAPHDKKYSLFQAPR